MGAELAVPSPPHSVPQSPARASAWAGSLVLVAVMVAVTGGGFLASAAVGPAAPASEGPGLGQPVRISDSVSVTPGPGWEVSSRIAEPAGVVLANGTATLTVLVAAAAKPRPLAIEYATEVLEPQAEWIQYAEPHGLRFPSGVLGFRFTYQGGFREAASPLEGEVTALSTPSGTGVVFDGTATQGRYGEVRDEVEAMIAGTVLS